MKDKGEIYIVHGECGEYSDHREWLVAAFTNKDRAEVFQDLLQQKYNTVKALFDSEFDETGLWPDEDDDKYKIPEDPNARIGHSSKTVYGVQPLGLNPKG